jgi:1-acyl-sn-glycerol-3-phosphate acyltransferase
MVFFILNAILGIILIEKVLKNTRRCREVVEERDRMFPAWRRIDAHRMTRCMLYPGAIMLLVPRLIALVVGFTILYMLLAVINFGRTKEELFKQTPGCRTSLTRFLIATGCRLILLGFCICSKKRRVASDYTKYLGRDYKEKFVEPCSVPTIISNHSGPLDIIQIGASFSGKVAFIAKGELESVPIIGYLITVMGGAFAPRFSGKAARDGLVEVIAERQKELESDPNCHKSPLILFSEGSTQNNQFLCPFKRGAFTTRTTIQPVIMTYFSRQVYPFNEVIGDLDCIIFTGCSMWPQIIETLIMDPFQPTDYLFETHKDEGAQDWQIQAWAIREAMSKVSGIPICDQDQKEHF